MMKKGQITLFVIFGAILLILILLAFTFRDILMEQATKIGIPTTIALSKEAREVKTDMTRCARSLAETGVMVMSMQGGYTALEEKIPHTNTGSIINYLPYAGTAYMYYKGENTVPTKETMERQLENFLIENWLACEKQYAGMEVDYGQINPSVTIKDDKILINIDSSVRVIKEEKESGFSSVDTELQVRLGKVGEVMNEIADEQTRTGNKGVCISCISRIAVQNSMELAVDSIGEDVFYMVTDTKSKIGGNNFIFIAANKF